MTVTNRPSQKHYNALNNETIAELRDCFQGIAKDSTILCVILTGAGEKSFVAGADIADWPFSIHGRQRFCDRGQGLLFEIENLPQPVIAAVNGFAFGGGCEIAMACDIRLASENAKLGQPEVNLGIIPGYGGTQRLARLVGRGKAKQLIFTGDIIPAAEAYRIGLVDEIYPLAELLPKAKEMAQKIASKGPLAVRASKEAINRGLDVDLGTGCAFEGALFAAICGTEDKADGTKAFLEKRKADSKGK